MNSLERNSQLVDFGYRYRTVRAGRFVAVRLRARGLAINGTLLGVAVVAGVLCLGIGEYPLNPAQVVQTLLGQGSDFQRLIVTEWRLPAAVAALVLGALLGIGGAVFQSLTRNPLGSPDVIGFDAGAYTAVLITILLLGVNHYWALAAAALIGGLLTAVAVYLLANRGGVQGFRLIVVGIAFSAMLGSVNVYLTTRADITDAMSAGFWAAGSLARVGWQSLIPIVLGGVLLCVAVTALAPALRQLELGDDAALAQGVRASLARPLLVIVGVATTALVTAAAGPIGFVALSAPQLARRVTRTPGVTVAAAACMGAALLTLAQLLTLVVAEVYRPVPVGLITVSLGGVYLIWLLIRETRKQI